MSSVTNISHPHLNQPIPISALSIIDFNSITSELNIHGRISGVTKKLLYDKSTQLLIADMYQSLDPAGWYICTSRSGVRTLALNMRKIVHLSLSANSLQFNMESPCNLELQQKIFDIEQIFNELRAKGKTGVPAEQSEVKCATRPKRKKPDPSTTPIPPTALENTPPQEPNLCKAVKTAPPPPRPPLKPLLPKNFQTNEVNIPVVTNTLIEAMTKIDKFPTEVDFKKLLENHILYAKLVRSNMSVTPQNTIDLSFLGWAIEAAELKVQKWAP